MFKTLMLAIDVNDPDGAERCTAAAVNMARHEGAKVHVLNVVPDDGMAIVSASLSPEHGAESVTDASNALNAWVAANMPEGIETETHVARGTVYDQIIRKAVDLGVDGIFVGAHGPAFKDYLLGSNAARVARHAKQSVFVIR